MGLTDDMLKLFYAAASTPDLKRDPSYGAKMPKDGQQSPKPPQAS